MEYGVVQHVAPLAGTGATFGVSEEAEHLVVDVVFDHHAAVRAASELRRSATALAELLHERARARNALLAIWNGPAAEQHALEFARSQADGHDLIDRMHRTAGRIDEAANAARGEQRRREHEAVSRQIAAAGLVW